MLGNFINNDYDQPGPSHCNKHKHLAAIIPESDDSNSSSGTDENVIVPKSKRRKIAENSIPMYEFFANDLTNFLHNLKEKTLAEENLIEENKPQEKPIEKRSEKQIPKEKYGPERGVIEKASEIQSLTETTEVEDNFISGKNGTKEWIENFLKNEGKYSQCDQIEHFEDGHKFMTNFHKTKEWKNPMIINNPDGLGLLLPNSSTFDIDQLINLLGANSIENFIEVYKQKHVKMKLKTFLQKWKDPNRENIYNLLSCEFSNTKLAKIIHGPKLMYDLSWVHKLWPENNNDVPLVRKPHIKIKPSVSTYCLLGMAGSYTDFHIDFGGSSVWYHCFKGQKIFYLIEPLTENLEKYIEWLKNPKKLEIFFGNLFPENGLKEIKRVVLNEGETFMMPSGWIHAVYTPMDSIVFGGNYLHNLNIKMQLRVNKIEANCNIHEYFRFPSFELLHWYAAKLFLNTLKTEENQIPSEIVDQYRDLLPFLKKWQKRDKNVPYFNKTRLELENALNQYDLESSQ